MEAEILQWCVPAVFGTLAVLFGFLRLRGAGYLRLGFALTAVVFATKLVPAETRWDQIVKLAVENGLFLVGMAILAHFLARRHGRPARLVPVAIAVALGPAATFVAYSGYGGQPVEGAAMLLLCAGFTLRGAWAMRSGLTLSINAWLFAVLIVFAATLVGMAVWVLVLDDPGLTITTWQNTLWGFVVQLVSTAFAALIALLMAVAMGTDAMESLRTRSERDPLSGLLNRHGLKRRLAGWRTRPVILFLIDLDHFKTVNDRFGHSIGDGVIAGFGTLLRDLAGASGHAVRLGGEEFALILTDERPAETMAARLEQALAIVEWPNPLTPGVITASAGCVTLSPGETLESALTRADALLYDAKRAGRNRILIDAGDGSGTASPGTSIEQAARDAASQAAATVDRPVDPAADGAGAERPEPRQWILKPRRYRGNRSGAAAREPASAARQRIDPRDTIQGPTR